MAITQIKIGESFDSGEFEQITQAQINTFADATGDHQWIHTDAPRCAKHSPYKTTIAHGFLTLSLMSKMFSQSIAIDGQTTTIINYGLDSVRFIEAVRVNDRLKYTFTLVSIESKVIGRLFKFEACALIKDRTKPALVGSFLLLLLS